jgi:hypothetical protein
METVVIEAISNLGVPVGVLIYFMWYNNNTMSRFMEQMKSMNDNIITMLTLLEEKKEE